MRNPAAHLQRQWSPFYNRLSSSSQSSTNCQTHSPSAYSNNISPLANNKIFFVRNFTGSTKSLRLNNSQQFSQQHQQYESIDTLKYDDLLLTHLSEDHSVTPSSSSSHNSDPSATPISTGFDSSFTPKSILTFRGPTRAYSFQCAWFPRRTYSDDSTPSQTAPSTPTPQHERRRGNKRLARTEKLIRRRLERPPIETPPSREGVVEVSDERLPVPNTSFKKGRDNINSAFKRESSSTFKERPPYRSKTIPPFLVKHDAKKRKISTDSTPDEKQSTTRNRETAWFSNRFTPLTGSSNATTGSSSFAKEKNGPNCSSSGTADSTSQSSIPHIPASMKDLKPSEVVQFLDQHIVGQLDAKKAVANALRNRWRRQQLRNVELRDDIACKNILMIGPTGSGKTEIARRMAKILDAPFIKVEATKYTEVGFHGRDVDTIIKDLVEFAVRRQYVRLESEFFPQAQRIADERILQALTGQLTIETDLEMYENLRLGKLDNQLVSVEIPYSMSGGMSGGGFGSDMSDVSSSPSSSSGDYSPPTSNHHQSQFWTSSAASGNGGWRSSFGSSSRSRERTEKRTMSVKEARSVLANVEFSRMIGSVAKARITQQALESVEQEGIVFLDEIDKICSNKSHAYSGPDASAEGVQRDLLPLIEGTTINTRYGNVKTDHILFIASGAFHSVKPSDMMAELQGRLPVRVELKPLTEEDFRKILTETRHNLLEQNIALLATEGVTLLFEPAAAHEIARFACEINSFVENIGARRLVTVLEKIMEEISFVAPEMESGSLVRITEEVVRRAVAPMIENTDLHKFIL